MAYTTSLSLLEKLRQGDTVSQEEFFLRYEPFVRGVAATMRLSGDESDELVSQTMLAALGENGILRYRPENGCFRGYLYGIIKHKISDIVKKRTDTCEYDDRLFGEDSFAECFNREYDKYILALMLDELRRKVETATFDAFQLTELSGYSPAAAARALDMTVGSVYAARSRCLSHLRTIGDRMRKDDPELRL